MASKSATKKATTTKKPAAKPATQTTIKTQPAKGVTYLFGGQYYAKTNKDTSVKNYELKVVFPEILKNPLSVFKAKVTEHGHPINKLMVKEYPDFSAVRTYRVLGVQNNVAGTGKTDTNDISLMGIDQLQAYIKENDLNIDTAVYEDNVENVRNAIKQAEEDPDTFASAYKKAVEDYEYKKELDELNSTNEDGNSPNDDEDEDDNGGEDGEESMDDLLGELDEDDNGGEDGEENVE